MLSDLDASLGMDFPRLQHSIMLQLCEVSFGPDLYTSPQIVAALERAIPMFVSMLNSMPAEKRHMKYALEIARQLGLDVRRMERSDERRMCFEAALILVLSYFPEGFAVKYSNVNDLIAHYPEFAEVEAPELLKLLNFRNMLAVALLLLPANHNRSHLLDLVTRLTEGRNVKYVTGSGAAIGTRRRVLLYQREGNITPTARPPRRENPDKSADKPPKKRVRNNSLVVTRTTNTDSTTTQTTTSTPTHTEAQNALRHLPHIMPSPMLQRPNYYASPAPMPHPYFAAPPHVFPAAAPPATNFNYYMPNVIKPHYQQFGSLAHSVPMHATTMYPALPSFFSSYPMTIPGRAASTSFEQWLREIWETSICSDQQGWAATLPPDDKRKNDAATGSPQWNSELRARDAYIKALELFLQLFLQVEQNDTRTESGDEATSLSNNNLTLNSADMLPTCSLSVMELLALFHAGALKDENPLRAEHLRSLGLFFCIKRCAAKGLMDCYGSANVLGGEDITAEYVFAVQNYFMMQSKFSDRQQVPWQTFNCLQSAYGRVMELYFRIISAVRMGLIKFRNSSWIHMRDMLFLDYQVMLQQLADNDSVHTNSCKNDANGGIHALLASAESLDGGVSAIDNGTKFAKSSYKAADETPPHEESRPMKQNITVENE